jgi:hypothetical protein
MGKTGLRITDQGYFWVGVTYEEREGALAETTIRLFKTELIQPPWLRDQLYRKVGKGRF